MQLHELIWKCLTSNPEIIAGLCRFWDAPAVFTPEAPPDHGEGWHGKTNYPRIVFAVDLSANEERKCQGSMILSVYAQNNGTFDFGASGMAIKSCLCNVILTPEDGNPYCLAWNRSDGFQIEGTNICGQEMQFDILEYASQVTTDPDPVDTINAYLKALYPEALVMWHDRMGQAEAVNAGRPVLYCRLENDSEDYSTIGVTWMECSLAVHVFSPNSGQRAKYARTIAKQLAVDGEIDMLDRSPFLISSVSVTPSSDYLRAGQLRISGRYGILRQTEKKKNLINIDTSYGIGG